MALSSISLREDWSSFHAPTKLVPQSEQNCTAGPRKARNLRKTLMKHEASIDSITLIWIALVVRHREEHSPAFVVGHSSSCPSSADEPRSKDLKANNAEWGCGSKSINGEIGHFLPTPQPLALNTIVNDTVQSSLPSDYPEPTASDQAECEMSPLMLYFFVIILCQET